MQTIKQSKYYLDLFIVFGLFIVKICSIFILKEKSDKVLTFNIVHIPNFEVSASL